MVICAVAPGCKIRKTIDDTVTVTTSELDYAIATVAQESSKWQDTLKDLESKLVKDAQTTVRNEVAQLLQGTIGVAQAGILCTVDFLGKRVVQELKRIKARFLKQPSPDVLEPAACEVNPPAVEMAHWTEGGVPKADIYGYDLEEPSLALWLFDDKDAHVDVTRALGRTSHYQVDVNLGGNGVHLTTASQRLVLVAHGDASHPIATINVIQAPTPICTTQEDKFIPKPVSLTPPKIGQGDADFDGNGPRVLAAYTLTISGNRVIGMLSMHAYEAEGAPNFKRKSDYTEVLGSQSDVVYTAPEGFQVQSFVTPPSSHREYYDQNHLPDIFPGGEGPVGKWTFVGDTDGDEAGTATKVDVLFNETKVVIVRNKNCVSIDAVHRLLKTNAISPAGRARLEKLVPAPH